MANSFVRRVVERFQQSFVVARLIPSWAKGRPLPGPQDYERLADEGYRQNVIIYACINEVQTSVAEPKVEVGLSSAGEIVPVSENDALARLLVRPNSEQSQYDFLEQMVLFFEYSGNGFIHKVRNGASQVIEIWNLRPDRMEIVPGPDGHVVSYNYKVGDNDVPIDAADVVHIALPDPLNDYWGLSKVAVAARWADLDTQAADFLRAFFENGGTPKGLLNLKVKTPPEERTRIKDAWREEYSGAGGWHSLAVLDADASYQEIGKAPSELNLESVFSETEARICSVFGVPPIIIGTKLGLMRSTYSNYAEARKSFWQETLAPMYQRIEEKLTHGLAWEFSPNHVIRFDLTTVAALQEDEAEKRKFALDAWDTGLMTLNESREWSGLEPVDNGDVVKEKPPAIVIPVATSVSDPVRGADGTSGADGTNQAALMPPERLARFTDVDAKDPFYIAVHRIADKLEPKIRKQFLSALDAMRDAMDETTLSALADALAARNVSAVAALLPWDVFDKAFLEPIIVPPIPGATIPVTHASSHLAELMAEALAETGELAAAELSDLLGASVAFDVTNPQAIAWAEENAASLVTQVSQSSKDAIRALIVRQFEEGAVPYATEKALAKIIRESVGLTSSQERAVSNFRTRLATSGAKPDVIAKRTAAFRETQIRRRARTISRTETIRASSQGQQSLWGQAKKEGLLTKRVARKVWITTPDDRLDQSVCEPMPYMQENLKVGIDDLFTLGDFSGAVPTPPAHPMCRCAMSLHITREKGKTVKASRIAFALHSLKEEFDAEGGEGEEAGRAGDRIQGSPDGSQVSGPREEPEGEGRGEETLEALVPGGASGVPAGGLQGEGPE